MKPLTQYGLMAEKHWRKFLPKMVADLEAKGLLHQMLLAAEEERRALKLPRFFPKRAILFGPFG